MKRKLYVVALVALVGVGLLFQWLMQQSPSEEVVVPDVRGGVPSVAPVTDVETVLPRPPRPYTSSELSPLRVEEPAIRGHVVDTLGTPIANADVAVYHRDKGAYRTTTDEAGRFAVGSLAPLKYRVSVNKAQYNEALEEEVGPGGEMLELVLTPVSRATGRVVDGSDEPVTEFDIVYQNVPNGDDMWWRELVRNERTPWKSCADPEGRFSVDNVASGVSFVLGARAPGYEAAFVTVPPAEPGDVAAPAYIRLQAEALISGLVLSPDRRPVAGAEIRLRPGTDASVIATSDNEGRFEVAGLSDAPLELTATDGAYLPATVRAQPKRGKTVQVELMMGLGGDVEGTVWKGSVPAEGQKVLVSRLTPPRVRKVVVTDSEGHYAVTGVGTGMVTVLAKWADPEMEGSRPLRMQRQAWIEAGQTTVVDIQFPETLASIEGNITVNGGVPDQAEVKGTVFMAESQSAFSTHADETGRYRVENVFPGSVFLEVTARLEDVEVKRNFDIELADGHTVQHDVDFDVIPGVSGFVSGLSPGDVGQVLVLQGHEPVDTSSFEGLMALEGLTSGSSDIGEDGSISISGLEPGPYTLVTIIFSGDVDTGAEALDSTRASTHQITVPDTGAVEVTLSIAP